MARVTVEDSLEKAKNRFALTQLTAQRAKQLFKGSKSLSEKRNNREIVTALREIAEGKVRYSRPEILNALSADAPLVEPVVEDETDIAENEVTE